MGHVKVVKSSPYFSRFQTKVRAVCACAQQFPVACAARSYVARISRKASALQSWLRLHLVPSVRALQSCSGA
jgi:hypothetical protein